MGSAASHRKGRRWEYEFCSLLSLWVSDGESMRVFRPRPASGGAPSDRAGLTGQSGDVQCDDDRGGPVIRVAAFELKHYADLSGDLWRIVANDAPQRLLKFWHQARESARAVNKVPVLVFKADRRQPIIVTPRVCRSTGCWAGATITRIGESRVWMFGLRHFLSAVPVETFVEGCTTWLARSRSRS